VLQPVPGALDAERRHFANTITSIMHGCNHLAADARTRLARIHATVEGAKKVSVRNSIFINDMVSGIEI
jgi:hypothetical protein